MIKQAITAYLAQPWRFENGKAVAPVTMIVEGVHSGSAGPIFWPAAVLREAVKLWNGVPVSVDHPMIDGAPVSINHSSEITARHRIGSVVNPRFENNSLKAQVVIPGNDPRVSQLQEIREVSIGVFSAETPEHGSWNGESYIARATVMKPDHLALLPSAQGACSWTDGCGIRTNQSKGGIMEPEPMLPTGIDDQKKVTTNAEQEAALDAWANQEAILPPPAIQALLIQREQRKATTESQSNILLPTGVEAK